MILFVKLLFSAMFAVALFKASPWGGKLLSEAKLMRGKYFYLFVTFRYRAVALPKSKI